MVGAQDLGQEIASISAHVDAATHRLLECIRQFDDCCGWAQQGAVSCAHWLAWRVGLDAATAREKVRVARALGNLPAISVEVSPRAGIHRLTSEMLHCFEANPSAQCFAHAIV